MALKMILKTYQLYQPSKNMSTLSSTSHTLHHILPLEIDIYQSYMHGSEKGVAT